MLTGYDEEWVCQRFREARYPKQQIKILAECCCTTKQEILSILHLHGLSLDIQAKPRKTSRLKIPDETWAEAIRLIRKGVTLREVGDRLHIGHSTLEKWPDKAMELGLLTAAEIDETIKFRDQHRKGGTRRKPYAEDQTDQNGQV